jgi:hypothetical protein
VSDGEDELLGRLQRQWGVVASLERSLAVSPARRREVLRAEEQNHPKAPAKGVPNLRIA